MAKFIKFSAWACASLGVFCFAEGIFKNYSLGGRIFIGSIGLFFVALGLMGIYGCSRARLQLTDDYIIYYEPFRKETSIPVSDVKNVWVSNFVIVIDTGKGKASRFTIPLFFSQNHKIVAMLKFLALKRNVSSQNSIS